MTAQTWAMFVLAAVTIITVWALVVLWREDVKTFRRDIENMQRHHERHCMAELDRVKFRLRMVDGWADDDFGNTNDSAEEEK